MAGGDKQMIVELGLVKKYLRLEEDWTEDDNLLELFIENAEGYLLDAGVILDEMNTKLMQKAKLIALILITDWYENRILISKTTSTTSEKIRYIVESMLLQLKYCYIEEVIV